MTLKIRRCLNCNAPLEGTKCSYCDSIHEDPDYHEEVVTYYADGKPYFTEIIRPSSLSNIEFGKDSRKE